MVQKRKLNVGKYLAVLAVTTLIFIVGIMIGDHFSSEKLNQIDRIGESLKTDTMAMELQYQLIAEDPCAYINSTPLADELYEMASKLGYMENRLGEKDENVKELKNYYSLLEMKHWLYMQKVEKECEQNTSDVLFFYNNEDECPTCKEQGFILTWMRRNYENIYIYSFDASIENAALDTLKDVTSVTGTPAIVINGETYNKFLTKQEIQVILETNGAKIIQ